MKILGLCCGRKMGNSEVLVREALMGAEEMGFDVEIIHLLGLHIKPCLGCNSCALSYGEGGSGECVIKGDDMPFVREKYLECDGIIIGIPVFELQPPGIFKVLNDRMGPAYDPIFAAEAKRMGCKDIDERFFKARVGGFIAVGGGPASHLSLALPAMNGITRGTGITVVDQLMALHAAAPAEVLLNEPVVERARKLGRNVAGEIGKSPSQMRWMGDEPGICPVCHTDLLLFKGKTTSVICPICSLEGTIKTDGDEITVAFNIKDLEDQQRLKVEYIQQHLKNIKSMHDEYSRKQGEIQEKLKKYKLHKSYSKPGSKND